MPEDQSDKYSSCDPAAPVSNRRSGRLKPWPKFLRTLSVAKLILSCHNKRLGDDHMDLTMEGNNVTKKDERR